MGRLFLTIQYSDNSTRGPAIFQAEGFAQRPPATGPRKEGGFILQYHVPYTTATIFGAGGTKERRVADFAGWDVSHIRSSCLLRSRKPNGFHLASSRDGSFRVSDSSFQFVSAFRFVSVRFAPVGWPRVPIALIRSFGVPSFSFVSFRRTLRFLRARIFVSLRDFPFRSGRLPPLQI